MGAKVVDQVPFHNLDVVEVAKDTDVGARHAVNELGRVVHVVEKVAGVVHVSVQDFDDGRDVTLLEHRRRLAERLDRVRHLLGARHPAQFVPRKHHQLRAVHFFRRFDGEPHLLQKRFPFSRIDQAAAGRGHALVCDQARAGERVFLFLFDKALEHVRVAPVEHLESVEAAL